MGRGESIKTKSCLKRSTELTDLHQDWQKKER